MTVEVGHPPLSLEVTVTLKDLDVLCKGGVIWQCKDDRTAGRTKGVRHTCPGPSKGEEARRDTSPLKELKVREESEGSPGLKAKVQRIAREVTSVRDQKSEVHKTKGTRVRYGDSDGEQCGRR